jgi:predicted GNAT family N-acyltransferase
VTPEISVTRDIATCRELRRIVFIEEQGFAEAVEVDDRDDEAIHLLAQLGGKAVGSARLLILGETGKIGRVCVLPAHRGSGLGSALIRRAVVEFRNMPGITRVKLGAQVHASGFYERLGFVPVGEEYFEAGFLHRDMALAL